MPRKRELYARRNKQAELAEKDKRLRDEMRASLLARETPSERAEREKKERDFAAEQARRPAQPQQAWSKRIGRSARVYAHLW